MSRSAKMKINRAICRCSALPGGTPIVLPLAILWPLKQDPTTQMPTLNELPYVTCRLLCSAEQEHMLYSLHHNRAFNNQQLTITIAEHETNAYNHRAAGPLQPRGDL